MQLKSGMDFSGRVVSICSLKATVQRYLLASWAATLTVSSSINRRSLAALVTLLRLRAVSVFGVTFGAAAKGLVRGLAYGDIWRRHSVCTSDTVDRGKLGWTTTRQRRGRPYHLICSHAHIGEVWASLFEYGVLQVTAIISKCSPDMCQRWKYGSF